MGTKIHTIDFRRIRKVRKALTSQRSWISAKPHIKTIKNTKRQTEKYENQKTSKIDLIPNLRMSVTTRQELWLRELLARFLVLAPKTAENLIESQLE